MSARTSSTPRAEQRRRTEARILAAASRIFAEHGYHRTTIRAIASAARVNPGLVMHYFGSKEQLFAEATRAPVTSPDTAPGTSPDTGTSTGLAEQLLGALHTKLAEEPTATLAMLRSMLTHPEAAESVRTALAQQQRQLSSALDSPDAALRTGLTGAITLGVVVGRHLLRLDGLHDAPPEQIIELLRPCLESLTQTGPDQGGPHP